MSIGMDDDVRYHTAKRFAIHGIGLSEEQYVELRNAGLLRSNIEIEAYDAAERGGAEVVSFYYDELASFGFVTIELGVEEL